MKHIFLVLSLLLFSVSGYSQYARKDQIRGLVALFHFNEGSGVHSYEEVSRSSGTLTGSIAWTNGKRDNYKALSTSGIGYAKFIDNPVTATAFNLSATPFTVFAWVKYPVNFSEGIDTIVHGTAGGTIDWALGFANPYLGGKAPTLLTKSPNYTCAGVTDPSNHIGEWIFIMATFDGTNGRMYVGVDGQFKLEQTIALTAPVHSSPGVIYFNTTNGLNGMTQIFDEVGVCKVALTLAEGKILYQQGLNRLYGVQSSEY